ncbi:MAG: MarR family winged helix-turn-helix transcriptional regulator [Sphingomonas sp.]
MTQLRLDDFVPYRLSYTSNLVSEAIARTYESLFGLTIPEWRLVAVIAEHDGITQAAICTRTGMDKVTVSRAAIALTARGLVSRAPSISDRRSLELALSSDGRALYAQIAPKALELEKRIFGGLGTQELRAFVATLRQIDAIVRDA